MDPRISIITLGVADLDRARAFYTGLGLPVSETPGEGIVFFRMQGTVLALYPHDKLAEDLGPDFDAAPRGASGRGFSAVTLAHNTRSKEEVDSLIARAEALGGKVEKPAQDTFWGGYSGYISDPDGHLWEFAWAEFWQFNEDGSLILP